MKWWRRVLWRTFDHAITNAYVIYSANNASSLEKIKTRLQFRLDLAQSLTAPAVARRRGPGRNPNQARPRLTGKHFLPSLKRCVVCAYKKVSGRSKIRRLPLGVQNVKFTCVLDRALKDVILESTTSTTLSFHTVLPQYILMAYTIICHMTV